MHARRSAATPAALVLVVSALLLGSCGSDPGPEADRRPTTTRFVARPDGGPPNLPQRFTPARDGSLKGIALTATRVAKLQTPTSIVARPGTNRMYVTQRAGLVRSLAVGPDGTVTVDPEPVLDLRSQTTTDSNRGVVGLAFSEDGSTLYVAHTNARGDDRIASYPMNGIVADASARTEILKVAQPYDDHNIDDLHLGPDGRLWASLGDGGNLDDPGNRAQSLKTPLGKVISLDPAKPGEYEIHAYGLRNPFRFSFDRGTGDLWIGDVGQAATEEVDHIPAGTRTPVNLGWSGYEGSTVRNPGRVPKSSVGPVFEMSHQDGYCAVIGGVVYRGTAIPDLRGVYLFGDLCRVGLRGLTLSKGAVRDERELDVEIPRLVSISEDLDGELWALSLDGGVYRLSAR